MRTILLLSDGHANAGYTELDEFAIFLIDSGAAKHKIRISTFGIGDGYNEDLMVMISQTTKANDWFIENPEIMTEILQTELQGLLTTVATDVEFEIESDFEFERINEDI